MVAAGDHQLVDAAQLLERQGGEERHLLQRDEVFHALSSSAANRLGRPPDPGVGVGLELGDLLLGERPRRGSVEALRVHEPHEGRDQSSRAEVYQRFHRLGPGRGVAGPERPLHPGEAALLVQGAEGCQGQLDRALLVVLQADAQRREAEILGLGARQPRQRRQPPGVARRVQRRVQVLLDVRRRPPQQLRPAAPVERLDRRHRHLGLRAQQLEQALHRRGRLEHDRLPGQLAAAPVAKGEVLQQRLRVDVGLAGGRLPADRLPEGRPAHLQVLVLKAGEQSSRHPRHLALEPGEGADRLQPHLGLRVGERVRHPGPLAAARRRRPDGRCSRGRVGRGVEAVEQLPRVDPGRPHPRSGQRRRGGHPGIRVAGARLDQRPLQPARRRKLVGQPPHPGVGRARQIRGEPAEVVRGELGQGRRREPAQLRVVAPDERLQLFDILRAGPAQGQLEVAQRERVRAQPLVDRVHVEAADPERREHEGQADEEPEDGQEEHRGGAEEEPGDQQADPGQHGRAGQDEVLLEHLEARPDLLGEGATEHVLGGVVDAGLDPVADDEQKEGGAQDGREGDQRKPDQRRHRQREDRVLHPRLGQQPGGQPEAQEELDDVAQHPGVADQDRQLFEVPSRAHEDDGDQVVGDAHHDQQHGAEQDQREDQPAHPEVVERLGEGAEDSAPALGLAEVGVQLVHVVLDRRPVESPLGPVGDQAADRRARGPDEHQRFGPAGRPRHAGRDGAGEDVAEARAGGDHGVDPLALQDVEVLGDEGPELQHHDLEGDRVDHVGDEADAVALAQPVGDEEGYRQHGVQQQRVAEGARDAQVADGEGLEADRRPDAEREHDEEERVGGRPGPGQEDGLGAVEGGVHRAAEDDREAGHPERALQLRAPDVQHVPERDQQPIPRGAHVRRRLCGRESSYGLTFGFRVTADQPDSIAQRVQMAAQTRPLPKAGSSSA